MTPRCPMCSTHEPRGNALNHVCRVRVKKRWSRRYLRLIRRMDNGRSPSQPLVSRENETSLQHQILMQTTRMTLSGVWITQTVFLGDMPAWLRSIDDDGGVVYGLSVLRVHFRCSLCDCANCVLIVTLWIESVDDKTFVGKEWKSKFKPTDPSCYL